MIIIHECMRDIINPTGCRHIYCAHMAELQLQKKPCYKTRGMLSMHAPSKIKLEGCPTYREVDKSFPKERGNSGRSSANGTVGNNTTSESNQHGKHNKQLMTNQIKSAHQWKETKHTIQGWCIFQIRQQYPVLVCRDKTKLSFLCAVTE